MCLTYDKRLQNKGLIGYSDADWGEDRIDRKSYYGYVFTLGGGAINWKSKKQNTVATSSAELEYVALSNASREAIFLKSLLYELNYPIDSPLIFGDNKPALEISKNPKDHSRIKHVDISYHFIRDQLIKEM